MKINNILEHKNYPTIMFLGITITFIFIFFSLFSIFQEIYNINKINNPDQITALAIDNPEEPEIIINSTIQQKQKEGLNSEKTRTILYLFFIALGVLIINVIIIIVLMQVDKTRLKDIENS